MTKAEGTVTLRSVNEDTGEIKEGSCSLEDFERLPGLIEQERQMTLFDGEFVRHFTFNCKSYKGISFTTPKPLKIGDEVWLTCRARVAEVKAYKDPEIGLVREHTLRLTDVHD